MAGGGVHQPLMPQRHCDLAFGARLELMHTLARHAKFGRKRIDESRNWDSEKASLLRAYSAALGRNQFRNGNLKRCASAERVL